MSPLGWIWLFGTVAVAAWFGTAAVLSIILAVKRRRVAFVGLGGAFLLAAVVSAMTNPIVNLFVFHKVADRNSRRMVADMRVRCPIGHDARHCIAIFGRPARTRTIGEHEIWTYDANPWWMMGWTEIGIGVVSNRIVGHWLDD